MIRMEWRCDVVHLPRLSRRDIVYCDRKSESQRDLKYQANEYLSMIVEEKTSLR